MITEYVLLLVLSLGMVTFVLTGGTPFLSGRPAGGIHGIFVDGIPQLAIRMEKHVMTGYLFCVQYQGPADRNCSWR